MIREKTADMNALALKGITAMAVMLAIMQVMKII